MNTGYRFVEEPHGHFVVDRPVPSPSTVFSDLNFVDPRFFTAGSRARGRAVHAGIHYALKGTLDWDTLEKPLHGYVHSALRLIERLKPKIIRLEAALYHPELDFAGVTDVDWLLDGWRWIVDWKTGKAPKVARYQTAAYEMLARRNLSIVAGVAETVGIKFKRAAVELQEDGSTANLVRYDDPTDGAGWLNLLGTYRIRQALRASVVTAISQGE